MHVIRLRRPWDRSRDLGSTWDRVDVPDTEASQSEGRECDLEGVVLYRRNFNSPTGLEASSRVLLNVDSCVGRIESIEVNGTTLPTISPPADADITDLLEPHNQVLIRLVGSVGQPARMSGVVSLAIEDGCGDNLSPN